MPESDAIKQEAGSRIPIPLVMIAVLAALTFGGMKLWDWYAKRTAPPPAVLTDEARLYIRGGKLQLSGVEMKASESFAKQQLVEIEGKISNQGERLVTLVEVTCVFRDPYGNPLSRQKVLLVGRQKGTLAPGQTNNFRIAFDDLPQGWNQVLPDLVIAQILFG